MVMTNFYKMISGSYTCLWYEKSRFLHGLFFLIAFIYTLHKMISWRCQIFKLSGFLYKYYKDLTIIGSDNGLSPGRRQAIIWTNAGILLIAPLGTNFSEILIKMYALLFKKMHLKMSSAKWPFCLGLNVIGEWLHPTWNQWCNYQFIPWSELKNVVGDAYAIDCVYSK